MSILVTPFDLLLEIFSYVSFADLTRLCQVQKSFRLLLLSDRVYDFSAYKRIITSKTIYSGTKQWRWIAEVFMGWDNCDKPWTCPNPKMTYRLVKSVCENRYIHFTYIKKYTFPAIYNYTNLLKKYLRSNNEYLLETILESIIYGAARGNQFELLKTMLKISINKSAYCEWVETSTDTVLYWEDFTPEITHQLWCEALAGATFGGHIIIAEYLYCNCLFTPEDTKSAIDCSRMSHQKEMEIFLHNKLSL